jgi:glutamyl-tRNA synthetase
MIKKREVRTRFAPSPTGFLHIGGARTALFNYLLSNQKNGQFVLRIEDTDIQRNKEYFIEKLYSDLCWLGLKPNESVFQKSNYGPYRQTERLNIYQEYINKLIEKKKAYYCFCSEEELKKEKEEYIKKNQRSNYQYSKKCFNLTKKQVKTLLENEKKHLIRFHVNQERNYKFLDLVRGEIVFKGFDIEDFVICRSSGVPLLNFAVVIDDYLMEISHVLRGEEHLSNTGKQLALYEALD